MLLPEESHQNPKHHFIVSERICKESYRFKNSINLFCNEAPEKVNQSILGISLRVKLWSGAQFSTIASCLPVYNEITIQACKVKWKRNNSHFTFNFWRISGCFCMQGNGSPNNGTSRGFMACTKIQQKASIISCSPRVLPCSSLLSLDYPAYLIQWSSEQPAQIRDFGSIFKSAEQFFLWRFKKDLHCCFAYKFLPGRFNLKKKRLEI